MKTAGIIVEYNPLHNGHVHHFRMTKEVSGADAVIAVMSGHFLQRGEPAIVNKWARTKMALQMGVDLVIELPVVYAVQPAEWFAYGAVSALHHTGIVNCLCFGSESGEIAWMRRLARQLALEPRMLQHAIKRELKTGASFPSAYTAALSETFPDADAEQLAQPNNTLGLHYLIALERLGSCIEPLTIPRTKSGYNDTAIQHTHIASATAIRKLIFAEEDGRHRLPDKLNDVVPSFVSDILRTEFAAGRGPISWESFATPLLQLLYTLPVEEIAQYHEVNEGLEYRIKRALAELNPQPKHHMQALLELVKTKRYTLTKLQRAFTRILLQHRKTAWDHNTLKKGTPYLRVLGFTQTGRELLKRMKRTAHVPIISNPSRQEHPLLAWDIRATASYALTFEHPTREELYRDYIQAPLQIE